MEVTVLEDFPEEDVVLVDVFEVLGDVVFVVLLDVILLELEVV